LAANFFGDNPACLKEQSHHLGHDFRKYSHQNMISLSATQCILHSLVRYVCTARYGSKSHFHSALESN